MFPAPGGFTNRRGKVSKNVAKIISVLVALTMVIGIFAVMAPKSAAEMSEAPKIAEPESIDVGPMIREKAVDASAVYASLSDGILGKSAYGDYYDVGDVEYFWDSYGGAWVTIEKRGEGEHCEVWVGTDLSFPEGDPRNAEPGKFTITDGQVDYIIEQFDTVIYPIEAQYFGEPDNLTGDNSLFEEWGLPFFQNDDGKKVMIVIYNIIDENYYDPDYPYYVAGFYSPTVEAYYDRNIIHIDCWDWANRTTGSAPRPYLYEGTVAHEYQHLLHDDADPMEETWLNEGCSMYSEFLCGYSTIWDNIYRFLYTPDNGLVDWGDQGDINILADYGGAMLFMIYLNDHFGGAEFISDLFHSTAHGAESVEEVLAANGFEDWTFNDVFKAFRLANLLHTDEVGDGWYNYVSLDWSDPDAMELYDGYLPEYDPYDYVVDASSYFGTTWTYDGYDTGITDVGSYGTDYFYTELYPYWDSLKFYFDGDDYVTEGWELVPKPDSDGMLIGPPTPTDMCWYSGAGDEIDYKLIGSVDLTDMESATLTFDTWYEIEEYWDFGFVQVSTDGGQTWTSLANEYTTDEYDPNAYPTVVENVPGLTGSSDGWITMSFNLTEYCGQEILISFRYVTDWAYSETGWYIDNVYINDELIDDGDSVIGLAPEYENTDFLVTFVCYPTGNLPWLIFDLNLNHDTEQSMRDFLSLARFYGDVIVLVTPTNGMVDYSFGCTYGWMD